MKTALHRLLLTGLLSLAAGSLHAQSMVPAAMNYQGMLTDADGDPVADAAPENRNVEFRIYSQATGGTPLWGESQTVTVYKGHFSVVLGNGTAVGGAPSGPASFAAVFANATTADLFFGITPQGGAEFAPRQKLLASAYALRARVAEQVNQTTGGSTFNTINLTTATASSSINIGSGGNLEFGAGVAGKEFNAGKIFYRVFSNGLDIKGAGNSVAERRITMWAEAGTEFKGPIRFASSSAQHIVMDQYAGMGHQPGTTYFRTWSNDNFAWYRGGSHVNTTNSPGSGGTHLATLNGGGFTLNTGVFTGNGSGLTNINPNSLPNNYNYLGMNGSAVLEFGRGVNKFAGNGLINYADNILHIIGGGTAADLSDRKLNLHAQGGLTMHASALVEGNLRTNGHTESFGPTYAKGDVVIEGSNKLNFFTPNRTGQHINLWGTEYGVGIGASTLYQRSGGAFKWYVGGTHDDGGAGAGGSVIADWNNERCDFNRRIYINHWTNTGTAPLEVHGASSDYGTGNQARFYRHGSSGGNAGYDNSYTTTNIGIYAAYAIRAQQFVAHSDLRIKLTEGRSDAAADLATLKSLEVTDYKLKDLSKDGGRPHKKLIAQQVEKVYPQAVSRSTGTVPDIYRLATAKDGLVTFNEAGTVDLRVGESVRLVQDANDVISEVLTVNERGFTVKDALRDGEIFVYGRQVADFRLVDYEAISMLNVSATQELARQIKAQAGELAAVKAERDALARDLAALQEATAKQGDMLAALQAKFEALARPPAAQPVSLQAKAGGAE